MPDEYYEYGERAHTALERGEHTRAGELFTAAAYVALGASEFENRIAIGSGIASLLTACVCFHLGGETERGQNRSRQGLLIVDDLRVSTFEGPVQEGLSHELAGDFRVLGGFGGHDHEYEQALEGYEQTTNPFGWMGEPEFELPITLFIRLARSADWDLDEKTELDILNRSLVDRIEYKKQHFPAIFRAVLENGTFTY